MNKIIIKNNLLEEIENEVFSIHDHEIMIKKSGDYVIEYQDCSLVACEIKILKNIVAKVFISSVDNDLEVNNHYSLDENSQLLLFQFYYNKNVLENTVIDLNGENSSFREGFSSISRGNEEYHIIVNHNAKNVSSDIQNKCIGLDKSSITLDINSVLKRGNTDCVMDQSSRILTLGEVEAKIIPNMFIDEDSVVAKHGSVIGGFRDSEIFYLMSRGISYSEAIHLLIKGFIFSNLIVDMEKRAMIFSIIQNLRGE